MADQSNALRRAVGRVTATSEQRHAQELRAETAGHGACLIADVVDRQLVVVSGVLRTITLRPRAGIPVLEAELYDGSGQLALVWLGRREIPGIGPGRSLVAEGRVTHDDMHRPVIYNPRYVITPTGAA